MRILCLCLVHICITLVCVHQTPASCRCIFLQTYETRALADQEKSGSPEQAGLQVRKSQALRKSGAPGKSRYALSGAHKKCLA